MNIFFLDRDPRIAAQMQCDKHVVKMVFESAQLLSTALRIHGCEHPELLKTTHLNHPSAVWCRQTVGNYYWLVSHFRALSEEYTYRYGRTHKLSSLHDVFFSLGHHIPSGQLTTPPQCMPPEYRIPGRTVLAYRRYYHHKASKFKMRWSLRQPPTWWRNPG